MHLDLHSHSTFSDGSLAPEELLNRAAMAKLDFFAITDHDTLNAYFYIKDSVDLSSAKFLYIPGTELSTITAEGKDFHLLFFFPLLSLGDTSRLVDCGIMSPDDVQQFFRGRTDKYVEGVRAFNLELDEIRASRMARARSIIDTFNEKFAPSPPLCWEEFAELSGINLENNTCDGTIGRPHVAKYLLKRGIVASFQEAFDLYLYDGGPCAVKKKELDLAGIVHRARSLQAVPVLAHAMIKYKRPVLDTLIPELFSAGLRGLEVYHKSHDDGCITYLNNLLRRAPSKPFPTLGSDFHDPANSRSPDIGFASYNNKMLEEEKLACIQGMFEAIL